MDTPPPLSSGPKTPTSSATRSDADTKETAATGTRVCYPNWKPMPVPPHDLIDIEVLEEDMKKKWFKADYRGGFLHDETGKVDLPVDKKGILVVDPVTRTRLEDAYIEYCLVDEYANWICREMDNAVGNFGGADETYNWLNRLHHTVNVDHSTIVAELRTIVGEERARRGLSGFLPWVENYNRRHEYVGEDGKDDSQSSEPLEFASSDFHSDANNIAVVEHISEANNSPQIISTQPPFQSALEEQASIQHQADENTPLISRNEDESIQAYCCGCCVS